MKVKMVWRRVFIALLLLLVFLLFLNLVPAQPSQSPESYPSQVEEPSFSALPSASLMFHSEHLTLGVGRSCSLTLDTEGDSDMVLDALHFSSSAPSVASVSNDGTVTAYQEGTVTILAQNPAGASASCQITVVPITQLDGALQINLLTPASLTETFSLPEGTDWSSLVWTSSDPAVATAEGAEIRGHRFGSAVLTGIGPTAELHCSVQTGYGGQLIAHRGLSGQAPENTLPAFTLAGEAGAWGIETDVHCTTDGVFVCIHNEDIEEMTNGSGTVSSLSYEQLIQFEIDAGSNIQNYEHLTIPTLEQYLTVCKTYQATAVIELKEDFPAEQAAAFYDVLCTAGMEDQCVCISFDLGLLQTLREITVEIPVQYVVKEASEAAVDKAAALGNSGIDFKRGDDALIQYARERGCTTNVWTVDDPAKQEDWRNAGIDFITTNQISTTSDN